MFGLVKQIRKWVAPLEPVPMPTAPGPPRIPKPPVLEKFDGAHDPRYTAALARYKSSRERSQIRHREYLIKVEEYDAQLTKRLKQHHDTSTTIRTVIRFLLGIALFCIVTLSGIKDEELLTSTGQIILPILNFKINFDAFFIIGPVFLLAGTVYLHIFLGHHFKIQVPSHEAVPYIFNMDSIAARLVSWMIFYLLTPASLIYFMWKAAPIPTIGWILFLMTMAVVTVLIFTHMRRLSKSSHLWAWPLHFIGMGLTIALALISMFQGDALLPRPLNLANSDLSHKKLRALNLQGAKLNNARLVEVDLIGRNLRGADLTDADLRKAKLNDTSLRATVLIRTNLIGADLTDADLAYAQIENIKYDADTRIEKKWLNVNDIYTRGYRQFEFRDFSDAFLQGADLFGSNFRGADFSRSDLRGANLSYSSLAKADLQLSGLAHTNLRHVKNISAEQLRNACLDATTQLPNAHENLLETYSAPSACKGLWSPLVKNPVVPETPRPSFRLPTVGPIVGHTTSRGTRIWIAAADSADGSSDEDYEIGVAIVLNGAAASTIDILRASYIPILPDMARTGIVTIGDLETRLEPIESIAKSTAPLTPGRRYRVKVGILSLRDILSSHHNFGTTILPSELARLLPTADVWVESLGKLEAPESVATFRTCPELTQTSTSAGGSRAYNFPSLTFMLGSNRYPGLLWKKKQSDQIFKAMYESLSDRESDDVPYFVLFAGNQIYADLLNRDSPSGLADTYDEFHERYTEAFSSTNMRRLLRSLPTYMAINDHEIEDNWTRDRLVRADKRRLFNVAVSAYMAFQWSHSPRNFEDALYYQFDCGGYAFFVLDVRTQRIIGDEGVEDNFLLGRSLNANESGSPNIKKTEGQLKRLINWLYDLQERRGNAPKFIVSPTPFVPDINQNLGKQQTAPIQGWSAFPITRRLLLEAIVRRGIKNVVFLSGGFNSSNISSIILSGIEGAEPLQMYSINSSPLYWPFWFGVPRESDQYEQVSEFELNDGVSMKYDTYGFVRGDNFAEIQIRPKKPSLVVRFIDRRGNIIESKELPLAPFIK